MTSGDIKSEKTSCNIHKKGYLFILSAPSGAGKSTLCKALLNHYPAMLYSISSTTRPPRYGEQDGVSYNFISKAQFEALIKEDAWAEWAEVYGNYYGTSAVFISNGLAAHQSILLDIDIQGMKKIIERYPQSITIFIMPPSLETLKRRLLNRGTDSQEVIERRLKAAEAEIACKRFYKHVIVNDDLSIATDELVGVIGQYIHPKSCQ